MMCLGWYNRPTCKTRGEIEVVPPPGELPLSTASCPDISWFWTVAILIAAGAAFKTN